MLATQLPIPNTLGPAGVSKSSLHMSQLLDSGRCVLREYHSSLDWKKMAGVFENMQQNHAKP